MGAGDDKGDGVVREVLPGSPAPADTPKEGMIRTGPRTSTSRKRTRVLLLATLRARKNFVSAAPGARRAAAVLCISRYGREITSFSPLK